MFDEEYQIYGRCMVCCDPIPRIGHRVAGRDRPRRCLDCAKAAKGRLWADAFPIPMSEWFAQERREMVSHGR